MRNVKLTALAVSAVLLATMGLSACGNSGSGSADGVTNITIWHGFTESDGDTVQALANNFNKSQSKYKVTVEQNPWNVINDKLLSSLSAGTGPDLVVTQPDTARGYIEQGAFADVDDFYSNASNETSTYRKNIVNDGIVDGKHYGVPMGHAPYSVYFNKAIFDKAGIKESDYPTTMDGLVKLAQKLTVDSDGDGTPDQYGIAFADKDSGYIPTLLQGAGSDLVVNGKVALTSSVAKKTLTYWRDNVYAKKVSPSNLSYTDAQSLFISGKAAMFYIGPWIAKTAKDKGITTGTFEFPAGSKAKVTLAASNYWYTTAQVRGNDQKKAAVYAFMKYFNNKKNQITWATEANYPPNRTDITTKELSDNALIAQITPYMDNAKLILGSVPTGFVDVQSELNALGPKISASTGDISSILKESNDKIQALITK